MNHLDIELLKRQAVTIEKEVRHVEGRHSVMASITAVVCTVIFGFLVYSFAYLPISTTQAGFVVTALFASVILISLWTAIKTIFPSESSKQARIGAFIADSYLRAATVDPDFEMYRLVEITMNKKSFGDLTIREGRAIKQGYIYNLLDTREVFSLEVLQQVGALEWQNVDALESMLAKSTKRIASNPNLFELRLFDKTRKMRATLCHQ